MAYSVTTPEFRMNGSSPSPIKQMPLQVALHNTDFVLQVRVKCQQLLAPKRPTLQSAASSTATAL